MSVFADEEIEYLKSQLLGRLATGGPDGQPHVVPVGFRYNAELDTIDIGGHPLPPGGKYPDVERNPRGGGLAAGLATGETLGGGRVWSPVAGPGGWGAGGGGRPP